MVLELCHAPQEAEQERKALDDISLSIVKLLNAAYVFKSYFSSVLCYTERKDFG